jgi:glycopeptide antibiotics resistance protein
MNLCAREYLACTRYFVMVATPKQASLARSLAFIQKRRSISTIAFSALLFFVMFVKTPQLLFKSYCSIRRRSHAR